MNIQKQLKSYEYAVQEHKGRGAQIYRAQLRPTKSWQAGSFASLI